MADRKATNKYYPPEWDPSKGSINQFRGQHPLRARARKLESDGILVVRFEMPFHVWCDGCQRVIGKGVRFNAEKQSAGKYFSSTIWKFTMKCSECSQKIVIQTDPQNSDFAVISGAHKKTVDYDEESAGIVEKFMSEEERQKIAEDPLMALEQSVINQTKAEAERQRIVELQNAADIMKDDFEVSMAARAKMRQAKAAEKALLDEAKAKGLGIPLLPKSDDDCLEARERITAAHKKMSSKTAKQIHQSKRKELVMQTIFPTHNKSKKNLKISSSLIKNSLASKPMSSSGSSSYQIKIKVHDADSSRKLGLDAYNSSTDDEPS
eukprot:TRINITY_DN9993_c0_g1_i2.p1 TRINITY_DN9993_c0_g1~~TRINITY_DN9993_c0_g1_i2.p1  ORF type:complete len:322 (+),score=103.15 TRINITY_DN9993_c0_g1_i2:1076-2041(+)